MFWFVCLFVNRRGVGWPVPSNRLARSPAFVWARVSKTTPATTSSGQQTSTPVDLVDWAQCSEQLWTCTTIWRVSAWHSVPKHEKKNSLCVTSFLGHSLLVLFIAFVFDRRSVFTSRTAVYASCGFSLVSLSFCLKEGALTNHS